MASNRRLMPLVLNSAAALVCIAFMIAIVSITLIDTTTDHVDATTLDEHATRNSHRLAFAQPGAFEPSEHTTDDPQLRPTLDPRFDDEESWPAETHSETPPARSGWRSMLLPSLGLPSQIVKPSHPLPSQTLKTRLAEISPTAATRLTAKFEAAKVAWPAAEIALVAIKDEKILELHARSNGSAWKLIHRYQILAASGIAGPKLRKGDRQVPEGIYGIALLNPNSAYHLSLRVNYPNTFDRQMAAKDGRKDLGGDIMIHGKNLSAGCLAMGDEAVEELFMLAAQIGLSNIKLIISPTDFRQNGVSTLALGQPEWLPKLYAEIATSMAEFKAPRSTGLLSLFMK
jgi:hypothetical protein